MATIPPEPRPPNPRLAEFYLEDATDRLRFQQEFSLAGFKTLILINGGAVIGLLTYAGNAKARLDPGSLKWAFAGYIAGLACAVFSYLCGYLGQAQIMLHSSSAGLAEIGVAPVDQKDQDRRLRLSNVWINIAIGLCVASLLAFIGGSAAAMFGLT
jgi:hypothetical protein